MSFLSNLITLIKVIVLNLIKVMSNLIFLNVKFDLKNIKFDIKKISNLIKKNNVLKPKTFHFNNINVLVHFQMSYNVQSTQYWIYFLAIGIIIFTI